MQPQPHQAGISEKTPINLGVVITLVGLTVALTTSVVRGESQHDRSREQLAAQALRVATLESWKDARLSEHTSDALKLQRIEDTQARMQQTLEDIRADMRRGARTTTRDGR